MIIPRVLSIRDWATWDRATVALDTPGITFVRGRNLDDVGNPNGCGKSSLFNSMYVLNHGQHQLAANKRSAGKLSGDTTRIREKLEVNGHKVVADMLNNKLSVTVDDARVEAHKKNDERVELLSIMNTTAELWSATVHVNGIAANPLLRGTSAARCQFLERAFNLDRWSSKHQQVGDIIAQMRRADDELDRARSDLNELGAPIDIEQEQHRLKVLQHKHRVVRKFLSQSQVALGKIDGLPPRPTESFDSLSKRVDNLERVLSNAAKSAKSQAVWEQAVDRRREIKHEIGKLDADTTLVHDNPNIDDEISKAQAQFDKWNGRADAVKSVQAWLKVAEHIAHEHSIPYDTIEQLHALSKGWVKNWHDGQSSCPVCGSKLKRRVDGEQLRRLAKLIDAFDEPFDTSKMPNMRAIKKNLDGLKAHKALIKQQTYIKDKMRSLREQLNSIEVPPRPKHGDVNIESITAELSSYRDKLSAAKQWERAGKLVSIDSELLKRKINRAQAIEDKLSSKVHKIESLLDRAQDQAGERIKLKKRIDELESEQALRPIYKALQMAYSPNGMRLWLLQELLEALVAGLNANSHPTRDQRVYGYRLSRNRDLALTASSLRGAYDLYLMSGGESALFALNFLTTLLPMLPESRRSSMLILDEVDSNCSARTRQIIADVYLPRLSKIVDTIFVMTPCLAKDFRVPGAHEMLVTKKNQVSTLEVLQ